MYRNLIRLSVFIALSSMALCACDTPQQAETLPATQTGIDDALIPRRPLWGDTHVHTNLSVDAFSLGNKNLGPEEAYKFAAGEPVILPNGETAVLRRPLDFLVVADHAEFLGVHEGISRDDAKLLENEKAAHWHHHMTHPDGDPTLPMNEFAAATMNGEQLIDHPEFYESVWARMIDLAEAANNPGTFTTLAGYEWSSAPTGNNLHRVVVFRDGADRLAQHTPFSALDGSQPEQLWAALKEYEDTTGGQVLAIPHNPNISGGKMFSDVMSNGLPINEEYAKTRAHFETILEVTQIKGDSETHPFLSPDDEFADFERWDRSNVGMVRKHKDEWFEGEYARSALKRGMLIENETGVNPFQFGMIGSTDQHNSLPNPSEEDFTGKFTVPGPGKDRWKFSIAPETVLPQVYYEWELAAAGYAAVWAPENTRESIFDALKRRETYATTGPRIEVRFFASQDFHDDILNSQDWVANAYAQGQSMGTVLQGVTQQQGSPEFVIYAKKDSDGATLERVQIIKGWVDSYGEAHEHIYDLAIADDNAQGEDTFRILWSDPNFKASEQAFYYVRVLEIPTPRWTTYDIERYGAEIPDHVPRMIQERAYTCLLYTSDAADD